jgi:hypothetical protein
MNLLLNFLGALGLTLLGIVLLVVWWWGEDSGRFRVRGRLGGLPYIFILIGVFFMGSTIWLGVTSFFTRSAQQTSQREECINWPQVSISMIGTVKCVYGNVYKTRSVGKSTFQILFSDDSQDFFLAGGSSNFNVGPGDCVVAKGEILRSGAGVPYIDIDTALYPCEPGMK